jgi:hypothetical protein
LGLVLGVSAHSEPPAPGQEAQNGYQREAALCIKDLIENPLPKNLSHP